MSVYTSKKIKGLAFFSSLFFAASLFGSGLTTFVDSGVTLYGVTPDGARALGEKDGKAIYWSQTEGAVALPGGTGAYAISAGSNGTVFGNKGTDILYWTLSDGDYSVNTISIGTNVIVNPGRGISHNGLYIVGRITNTNPGDSTNVGMKFELDDDEYTPTRTPGLPSPNAVGNDGMIVAGNTSGQGAGYYDFSLPGVTNNPADGGVGVVSGVWYGSDATGTVMVGQRAFIPVKWVIGGGYIYLTFPGTTTAASNRATAITPDGTVVVGRADGTPVGGTSGMHAFRWTQAGGMQTVEQWLNTTGSFLYLNGLTMESASGVSDDGNTIVGLLSNGDSFFAVAGQSFVPSSVFMNSLSTVSGIGSTVMSGSDFMMHGAHGHPGRSLVEPGKHCGWIAGDIGNYSDDPYGGKANVVDVGLCERVNDVVQLSLAFGRNKSELETAYDGTQSTEGFYVAPEINLRAPELALPLWLTASFLFDHSSLETQRGYQPGFMGEVPARSKGNTHANLWGYRLRLDAVDAFMSNFLPVSTKFTPYVDFSHFNIKAKAYTETDGDFIAEWDSAKDKSMIVRLGVDSRTELGTFGLLGTIELAHRIKDQTADVRVVIDENEFFVPGRKLTKDWLHLGAGVEGKIGKGIASFTLNATTQNEAPTYWGAASYRIIFE